MGTDWHTMISGVLALIMAMVAVIWFAHSRNELDLPIVGSIVLFLCLIVSSAIDIRTGLLPDWLTFPLIGLGLIQNWAIGNELWPYMFGGVAGYLTVFLLSSLWVKYRGEIGMGLGDAKLLAAAGTWAGFFALPMVMLIASATGLIFVLASSITGKRTLHRQMAIPFGPFLALGMWTMWCNTDVILKL